jgi:hypothetical protein
MFLDAMSSKRLDSISDYHRHGFDLRVVCLACGRVIVLGSLELSERLHRKGTSRDMSSLERRLRCAECGGGQVKCGPVERQGRSGC